MVGATGAGDLRVQALSALTGLEAGVLPVDDVGVVAVAHHLAAGLLGERPAAIQGELDQLGRRRTALEDAQLAAVEALEGAQGRVRDLAAEEGEIRSAGRELTAERDAAFARIDAEIDQLDRERAELAGTIDRALLDEYDAVRAATGGLGAVALHGRRLEGAPIQISPMEYSRIAVAPADEIIHAEEKLRDRKSVV